MLTDLQWTWRYRYSASTIKLAFTSSNDEGEKQLLLDKKYSPLPPCLLTPRSHVREKKRADRGGVVRSTEGWGQNVVLLNVAVFRMF